MNTKAVMVRIGELWLKSEPVKKQFMKTLIRNIKAALDDVSSEYTIEEFRGRILIYGDAKKIASVVRRVFGVVDVSICSVCGNTKEEIASAAISLAREKLHSGMRFAVRGKRQFVKGLTSQQLAAYVADEIWKEIPDFVVDLDNPEYEIFVEARDFGGLVYDERLHGTGGLPLGTAGRASVLLSSGIDSPVATWLMMRRGVRMVGIFVDAGCWAGPATKDLAVDNARILSTWCPGRAFPLWVVSIESFLNAMVNKCDRHYTCLFCKRFMMRVANAIGKANRLEGIVSGENLGQVASQTLQNMGVITAAVSTPVFRPLLTYDKEEIIALARIIGTYHESSGDTSCRAVPVKPATCSLLKYIESEEEKVPEMNELVQEVVSKAELWVAKNGEINQKKHREIIAD